MKKGIIAVMILSALVVGVGCTKQQQTKQFGGTYTLELPKGQKLVNITWKEDELWYLTRDMKDGEQSETYQFNEDSNYGVMEGKVIIKESK